MLLQERVSRLSVKRTLAPLFHHWNFFFDYIGFGRKPQQVSTKIARLNFPQTP